MLVRCDILAAGDIADFVSGSLAARVSSGWEEQDLPGGGTRFVVHAPDASFVHALAAELALQFPSLEIAVSSVVEQDWSQGWREYFTPISCGRFLVLPPWREHDAPRDGVLPVVIEPRSAFGTGHHASTALCLEAISELSHAGRIAAGMSFLDLGTGSGILGIACCRLGLSGIGLDTDPLAIDNAIENRERNKCPEFELATGGIDLVSGRRFDVALANILARPLQELAGDIVRALKPSASLALSGILAGQADEVEDSYRREGLGAARRRQSGEWSVLIWDGSA